MNLIFILMGSKVSLPAERYQCHWTGLLHISLGIMWCADQATMAAETYHNTLNEFNLAIQQVTQ